MVVVKCNLLLLLFFFLLCFPWKRGAVSKGILCQGLLCPWDTGRPNWSHTRHRSWRSTTLNWLWGTSKLGRHWPLYQQSASTTHLLSILAKRFGNPYLRGTSEHHLSIQKFAFFPFPMEHKVLTCRKLPVFATSFQKKETHQEKITSFCYFFPEEGNSTGLNDSIKPHLLSSSIHLNKWSTVVVHWPNIYILFPKRGKGKKPGWKSFNSIWKQNT